MADQFLDENGLAIIASKVNEKLKVVTALPVNPTSGLTVLYMGATTSTLTKGCIYTYEGANWVLMQTVDLSDYETSWSGTRAQWDQLSLAERAKYTIVHFDEGEGALYKDLYSTDEVKTNKVWIDGKPIYRKAFDETSLALSTLYTLANNVETIVNSQIMCLRNNNTTWSTEYYNTSSDFVQTLVSVNTSVHDASLYVIGTTYGGKFKGWFEYTKTTD